METLFKSDDALQAAKVLLEQITSMKNELRKIQSRCPEQFQLEESNHDDLEREVIEMVNETKVLKKSAPEGNVEDSNVQYYLAIAELEKNNGILRQQQKITQGMHF